MRIKLKLALGLVSMFLLIAALSFTGTFYIYRLSHDSKEIIRDNYASLQYCLGMQQSLDKIQQFYLANALTENTGSSNMKASSEGCRPSMEAFEKFLKLEEKNITETGEKNATIYLREGYEAYKATLLKVLPASGDFNFSITSLSLRYNAIKKNITQIQMINLNAMDRKSRKAGATGDKAALYVSVLGALAFLFSFTFVVNFPGTIGNPIIEITKKIKEVANRNYDERIEIRSRDEFGEMAEAFNTMASRLKAYEKSTLEELIAEKSSVEAIVKNLDEGIVLLDEEGRIKVVNPSAASLLGINTREWINLPAAELALANDLFREMIRDLHDNGNEKTGTLRITVNNEENYFIKDISRITPVFPTSGIKEEVGFIVSLRNITEFKKLDLAKTNFIAVISHELKTPISSINLSLKLLTDERVGELNEEQVRLVNSIKEDTGRLSKITKELLDISQVETGNIRLDIHETEAEKIVDYAAEALAPQLENKNIQLVKQLGAKLTHVKADLEKTVWVMTNLLANAIRYTPDKGKITISAYILGKRMYFSVEDKGPGIDEKNKERIFKRFVQIDGNNRGSGVGLGLAISKEFIQEQGGKIWVESEIGLGSKFVFTLPLAEEHASKS